MNAANPIAERHPALVDKGEKVEGSNPVRAEPTTNKKFKQVTRVRAEVQAWNWNDREMDWQAEWLYAPVTPDKKYL